VDRGRKRKGHQTQEWYVGSEGSKESTNNPEDRSCKKGYTKESTIEGFQAPRQSLGKAGWI